MSIHHRLLAISNVVNHWVERFLLLVGVVISVILFAQVVARYSGNSLSWSEEVGRYLLVATTFLGATVAYKRAHFIGLAGFGARFGRLVEKLIFRGLQLLTLGWADAAGPQQDQIGLEAEQALHVQLAVMSDRRQLCQCWRPFAAIEHAHQQVGGAQFSNDFRQGRRQADHPLGRQCLGTQRQQQDRQPSTLHPS